MSSEALLGDFVHAARAYLHLDPVAVGSHDCQMESLITVGLGDGYPVARAVGVKLVEVGDGRIYRPTDAFLLRRVIAVKNDAHCIEVVDLVERHMFGLHLVPDGIDRFETRLGVIFETHFVKTALDRLGEVAVYSGTARLTLLNFV